MDAAKEEHATDKIGPMGSPFGIPFLYAFLTIYLDLLRCERTMARIIAHFLVLTLVASFCSSVWFAPDTAVKAGEKLLVAEDFAEYPQETYVTPMHLYSLGEIYQYLGLIVYPEDKVWAFPDPALGIGSKITIVRAPIMYINDGGNKFVGRTWAETIADYFAERNLALSEYDQVSPEPGTLVYNGINIDIVRVSKSTETEVIDIPYKTIYKDDDSLEKGVYKVEQTGEVGKKEVVYQTTVENGESMNREIISERILALAVNKIIIRGTKVLYDYLGSGSATFVNGYPSMSTAFRGYRGSYLLVTNTANGKSVTVKVVDWGPAPWTGHYVDLSRDAFEKLAPLGQGIISNVKVELVL